MKFTTASRSLDLQTPHEDQWVLVLLGFSQDFSENWAARSENKLVGFDLLIVAGQGDITEVLVPPHFSK